MSKSNQLPTFLKASELAEMLDISEQSLAADRYRGEGIPFIKIGSRVRYRLDDVLKHFEQQNTVRTEAPAPPANRPGATHQLKRV